LKTNIAIATLFTAAAFLTPAHATTTLFTATPLTISSGNICLVGLNPCTSDYITTAGAFNGFPTSSMTSTPPSTTTLTETTGAGGHSIGAVGVTSGGDLGVGTSGVIEFGDYAVLDFANVKAGNAASTLSVDLAGTVVATQGSGLSYWVVYGYNTISSQTATGNLLAYGSMANTVSLSSSTLSGSLSDLPFYNYYAVGVMGDCAIDITQLSVTYPSGSTPTPEPGTFVMAGIAMIGLGVAMKKRSRKA
jgi:hypothetical protein